MKYYSRERILLAGTKYNSRGPNITSGDHILLAETKYYSREWNITRGNVLITHGTEKLLAGTKYYSREYNITRGNELLLAGKILLAGKNYYSRESIYYSRERFITRGREILAVYGTRGLPYNCHIICYKYQTNHKGIDAMWSVRNGWMKRNFWTAWLFIPSICCNKIEMIKIMHIII